MKHGYDVNTTDISCSKFSTDNSLRIFIKTMKTTVKFAVFLLKRFFDLMGDILTWSNQPTKNKSRRRSDENFFFSNIYIFCVAILPNLVIDVLHIYNSSYSSQIRGFRQGISCQHRRLSCLQQQLSGPRQQLRGPQQQFSCP